MATIAAPVAAPLIGPRTAAAHNLIGGRWVEGRGDRTREIQKPADTAEVLARVSITVDECARLATATEGVLTALAS